MHRMKAFGLTDIGRSRAMNQDSFRIDEINDSTLLCTVCDGMGGANGGNEASELAVNMYNMILLDVFKRHELSSFKKQQLRRLFMTASATANTEVFNKSNSDPALNGMGTTLVSVLVTEDKIYAVNVGDSRLYGIKGDTMTQLTRDHSYVQYLIDEGVIKPEEALIHPNRNVITRAIGTTDFVQADYFEFNTQDYDTLLLCSDGLSNYAESGTILSTVSSSDGIEDKVHKLIQSANNGGGGDNITVILVSLKEGE